MLTVAIPTYNRAGVLRESLAKMAELFVPAGVDWELIVVENNCTDDTHQMLQEFVTQLPLRTVKEPQPGVNNARNTAVAESRGDYIIFTDDDTLVCHRWLAAYAAAFQLYPEIEIFGGPIIPRFTSPPPAWLAEALPDIASVYGELISDDPNAALHVGLCPYGANMAFRTDIVRKHRFDPALGPTGNARINGSETELIFRLFALGISGQWVDDARVEHCIQKKQMTTRFLRWYFTGLGASYARDPSAAPVKMLLGRPRWAWRETAMAELRYRFSRTYASPRVWVKDLKRSSMARGHLTRHGKNF